MNWTTCLAIILASIGLVLVCGGCNKQESKLSQLKTKATQGDAEAQFQLGKIYDDGRLVPKDGIQAFTCYRQAAEQGHAEAQFRVASMYASGYGVTLDEPNH